MNNTLLIILRQTVSGVYTVRPATSNTVVEIIYYRHYYVHSLAQRRTYRAYYKGLKIQGIEKKNNNNNTNTCFEILLYIYYIVYAYTYYFVFAAIINSSC